MLGCQQDPGGTRGQATLDGGRRRTVVVPAGAAAPPVVANALVFVVVVVAAAAADAQYRNTGVFVPSFHMRTSRP
jgi:hypothetical protein